MDKGDFVLYRRSFLWISGVSLLAGPLSACGFSPVYGRGGSSASAEADLAAVEIGNFEDREGQVLRNLLLDRFNPKGRASRTAYSLSGEIDITSASLGTQLDATTTRSQVTVSVEANLVAFGGSHRFSSQGVASFSTSDTDYASEVARSSAVERSLRVIADDLRLQIATFFEKHRRLNG